MKIVKGIAVIDGDECISKWVIESGQLAHDQNMLPIVLKHIPIGGVVLDIGCYIGDHTIAYANKVGKDGNVFAYEPSDDAYRCAFYNMRLHDNTEVINIAIGAKNGTAAINKVQTNDGMNFLTDGNEIKVKTLDQVFIVENQIDRIDFIKIDCEGFELDVLAGGVETIKKYRPKMLIEINEMTLSRNGITRELIYGWLDSNGYAFTNIYEGQGLYEYQMDILCIPLAKVN